MNNFIFQNRTKVYFGRGCVKEYLACLTKKAGTILLAYGGGSIKANGVYDEISGILHTAGKTVVEFAGISPHAAYAKVQEGAQLARQHKVDMILAVGGGSVMDCCKAVSLAARYSGDIWADFWARPGVIEAEPLPLGAVVTAAGGGSACSGRAVLTNEALKLRVCRDYPALGPCFALMDPTYTYSVPSKQVAAGGFDVLSHLMETYFSAPDTDNVSDDLLEALIHSIIRDLRIAMQDLHNYTVRSNLMWDAALAGNGLVQMGKQCDFVCHKMAYQLETYCPACDHGCILAVLHPAYYRHLCQAEPSKFVRFAENVWHLPRKGRTDSQLALAGIDALAAFIRELGLPVTLKELGMNKAQLKEIAASCSHSQGCCKKMTPEEIYSVFCACCG